MGSKEDKALQSFRSGLNCAQAILTAYSDELSFDNNLALCLSCGFGGGMGRLQETCGAVTGSFMVLGICSCKKLTNNEERKEATYLMIQKFTSKFKSINGAIDCKTLIKCNLQTNEGRLFAKENKLFETICEKCITDSIRIVDELREK